MSKQKFEIWFVTGSQNLYGDETLRQVAEQSQLVTDQLGVRGNHSGLCSHRRSGTGEHRSQHHVGFNSQGTAVVIGLLPVGF